jgi:hypothetical protein
MRRITRIYCKNNLINWFKIGEGKVIADLAAVDFCIFVITGQNWARKGLK